MSRLLAAAARRRLVATSPDWATTIAAGIVAPFVYFGLWMGLLFLLSGGPGADDGVLFVVVGVLPVLCGAGTVLWYTRQPARQGASEGPAVGKRREKGNTFWLGMNLSGCGMLPLLALALVLALGLRVAI